MIPLIAIATGVGVFFLAKTATKPAPTVTPPEDQGDPRATLGGPDGAQSTASAGAPVTAFPAVGSGGPTGGATAGAQVLTAPLTAPSGTTGRASGTARPLTQTFQTKRPIRRDHRTGGTASEVQSAITAATGSLAPDLVH